MDKLKRCHSAAGVLIFGIAQEGMGISYIANALSALPQSRTFSFGRTEPDENGDWCNSISAVRAVEAWNRRCTDAEQDH